jgi:hypothetical protein
MKRTLRTAVLPPAMARWPRIWPESRLTGATPTRSAAVEAAEFRHLGDERPGRDGADAGDAAEEVVGGAPSRAAADGAADVAVELGELGLEHPEGGGDGARHPRRAGLPAAVLLHADHLDDLAAAAGDEFGQRPRVGVRHGFRVRSDALGEDGDRLGVEAVGLGEPAGGAGEVADLARVDHGQRQAGAGERGGHRDLETAGGLQHDEAGRFRPQPRQQPVEAPAVARHGEGLARRAEVHVEAIFGNVDADEGRRGGGRLIHGPSLRMRAHGHAAAAPATVRVPGWDDGRGSMLSRGLDGPRHARAPVRRQPRRLTADGQLRDTRHPVEGRP